MSCFNPPPPRPRAEQILAPDSIYEAVPAYKGFWKGAFFGFSRELGILSGRRVWCMSRRVDFSGRHVFGQAVFLYASPVVRKMGR